MRKLNLLLIGVLMVVCLTSVEGRSSKKTKEESDSKSADGKSLPSYDNDSSRVESQQVSYVVKSPMKASPSVYDYRSHKGHKEHKSEYHKGRDYKGKHGYKETENYKKNKRESHGDAYKKGYHDKGGKKYKGMKYSHQFYDNYQNGYKGNKGHDFGSKGYKKKGQKDKGYKKVYHKEEYHHKKKYYDDSDTKKHYKNHDDYDTYAKGREAKEHNKSRYKQSVSHRNQSKARQSDHHSPEPHGRLGKRESQNKSSHKKDSHYSKKFVRPERTTVGLQIKGNKLISKRELGRQNLRADNKLQKLQLKKNREYRSSKNDKLREKYTNSELKKANTRSRRPRSHSTRKESKNIQLRQRERRPTIERITRDNRNKIRQATSLQSRDLNEVYDATIDQYLEGLKLFLEDNIKNKVIGKSGKDYNSKGKYANDKYHDHNNPNKADPKYHGYYRNDNNKKEKDYYDHEFESHYDHNHGYDNPHRYVPHGYRNHDHGYERFDYRYGGPQSQAPSVCPASCLFSGERGCPPYSSVCCC